MKYSKPYNNFAASTMKNLLVMAFAILTIGCGEKKSDGVNAQESDSVDIESDGVNSDELEVREGVVYLKNSDSPYTGKCFEFHDNGQKAAEANFKDGEYDGLVVTWYENGQKVIEINYKDGKQDGLTVGWYENGQKELEINHKDGKMDGPRVTWHENGQKMMESTFKDNEGISEKYWNSKGEEVDSMEEAEQ
ncbi:toxin-antitoxin system YwqK family antitoxin [Akkermansiaceae bacterium]|nr:toxin-antitoxin system YwqK family antitoxin [Akkermansiaceae bacterium]